ncbi:MAG: outer membrane protein assembly factor BamD [Alphaproteobacteria bacterium]|nr:outer membrane protein assembly factor BamD [Alphaproteobacteria bacterium]
MQNRSFIIRYRGIGALMLAAAVLSACSANDEPEYVERPVEELYNEAVDQVEVEEYQQAAELFLEVERQHPYSIWATKAQLMSAFSYYSEGLYDDAILSADRFIQLHPGNRDISYAYYLKALSYYEQITDVGRDQRITELALQSLDEVVRRFPDSRYAKDSLLKLDLTRDHLAGKEMEVGRYYHERENYLAAINRYRNVIENYQTTTHVPEALLRLTEAYTALGIEPEARTNAAVLGHNFPGSNWYIDSYVLVEGEDAAVDLDGDGVPDRTEEGGFFSRLWPF